MNTSERIALKSRPLENVLYFFQDINEKNRHYMIAKLYLLNIAFRMTDHFLVIQVLFDNSEILV